MKKLEKLFAEAKQSSWGLRKLNFALSIGIPFNKPHRIKVLSLADTEVKTFIPYRRRNFNHIKGIHACGMATAAEFCSGLLLLSRVSPAKYRLIMQEMRVVYTYQAKSDVTASFSISEESLQSEVFEKLDRDGVVLYEAKILLHDSKNNLVAEAFTNWQIKSWEKVKTKA